MMLKNGYFASCFWRFSMAITFFLILLYVCHVETMLETIKKSTSTIDGRWKSRNSELPPDVCSLNTRSFCRLISTHTMGPIADEHDSIRRAFAPVNLITLRPSPFSIFTMQSDQTHHSPETNGKTAANSSIVRDMLATLGVGSVDAATFALNHVNNSRSMLDAYTTHGVNISLLHDVFMETNPAFPCASRLGFSTYFTTHKPKMASASQQIYRVAIVDVFDSPKQLVQSIQQDLAERSQPMFVHNERLRHTQHASVERAEDGLHAVLGIASGFLWRVVGNECQVKRCVFLRVQVHVPLFELSLQRFGVLQNRFRQALRADQVGASLVDTCQAGLMSSKACNSSTASNASRAACRDASEQLCSHFDLQYFGTHFVPNSLWGGSVDIVYRWILDEQQPTRSDDDLEFSYTAMNGSRAETQKPTSSSGSAVFLMEVRNCLNDYLNYQLLATPYRLDPLLCYSRLWKLATRARIVHNEIEGGSYEAQATLRDCIAQALTFSSSCWYSFNEWLQTVFQAPAMLMWHERTMFAPMFNLLSEHEQLAACYMRRLELYSSQVRQLPARVPACLCPSGSQPIFYFDFCYWLRRRASASVEMAANGDDEKEIMSPANDEIVADTTTASRTWQQVGRQEFTPQVCLCACDIFDPSPTKVSSLALLPQSLLTRRGARQASASGSPPAPTSSAALSHLPSLLTNNNLPKQSVATENRYYSYYTHYKSRLSTVATDSDGDYDELRQHRRNSGGVCGTGKIALPLATRTSITSLNDDKGIDRRRTDSESTNDSRMSCSSSPASLFLLLFLSITNATMFIAILPSSP